jgi:Anti-sigma factor NepR
VTKTHPKLFCSSKWNFFHVRALYHRLSTLRWPKSDHAKAECDCATKLGGIGLMNKSIELPKIGKARKVQSAFDPVETALRQLYDNVVSEPIPDDFLKLLDELGRDGAKSDSE